MDRPIRVIVGEDDTLVREGIVHTLKRADIQVIAACSDATSLTGLALAHSPDIVLTDIKMPPDNTDDGLRAALRIRHEAPGVGVIVLSQYLDDRYALDIVGQSAGGVGYLLKEKIASPDILIDAVRRVAAGGSAIDAEVVARLVGRKGPVRPLDRLTRREHEVLVLMAEGLSNTAIAERLVVNLPAVERHVTGILTKLDLPPSDLDHHRRVAAVLTLLHQ